MFVDIFGLFRTIFRTIIGVYLIYQFLPRKIRKRRSNILPVTLGPFATDLTNVFKSFVYIIEIDYSINIIIDDIFTIVVCFVGAFIGDIV